MKQLLLFFSILLILFSKTQLTAYADTDKYGNRSCERGETKEIEITDAEKGISDVTLQLNTQDFFRNAPDFTTTSTNIITGFKIEVYKTSSNQLENNTVGVPSAIPFNFNPDNPASPINSIVEFRVGHLAAGGHKFVLLPRNTDIRKLYEKLVSEDPSFREAYSNAQNKEKFFLSVFNNLNKAENTGMQAWLNDENNSNFLAVCMGFSINIKDIGQAGDVIAKNIAIEPKNPKKGDVLKITLVDLKNDAGNDFYLSAYETGGKSDEILNRIKTGVINTPEPILKECKKRIEGINKSETLTLTIPENVNELLIVAWTKSDNDKCGPKTRTESAGRSGSRTVILPPIAYAVATITLPTVSYAPISPTFAHPKPPCAPDGLEEIGKNKDNKILYKCKFIDTALGKIPTSFEGFISALFGILLSVSGGLALILIIISGYRIMASQGNPEKLKEAKESLTSAIIGLLFIIFSSFILKVIGVDILQIPSFIQ